MGFVLATRVRAPHTWSVLILATGCNWILDLDSVRDNTNSGGRAGGAGRAQTTVGGSSTLGGATETTTTFTSAGSSFATTTGGTSGGIGVGGSAGGGTSGGTSEVTGGASGASGYGGTSGSGGTSGASGSGGTSGNAGGPVAGSPACVGGEACSPKNPCKRGKVVCTSEGATCQETGSQPIGTACGASERCIAGMHIAADSCNELGNCAVATAQACSPFVCDAANKGCDTTRTIACGTNACTVQSQYCCYFTDAAVGACVEANQQCQGYSGIQTFKCFSQADCNQGEVCCGTFSASQALLKCQTPDTCTSGPGWTSTQFCDPKATSECKSGSCVAYDNATTFGTWIPAFPAGHYACHI